MDTKYIQSPKASDFQYSFDQITVSMSQALVPALHKSEDQPVYIDTFSYYYTILFWGFLLL